MKINCGCKVHPLEKTVDIRLESETICMFDGIVPAVEYKTVCQRCYDKFYSKFQNLILTDEQESLYLN